jgi:crotonobetainyl-CoA:carnitine CoA-transferase CaiB-like acyl-CoA transferase
MMARSVSKLFKLTRSATALFMQPTIDGPTPSDQTLSHQALNSIWKLAGQPSQALDRVSLNVDGTLPSRFQVGPLASATIAAQALAATEIFRVRTGQTQTVAVQQRRALAMFRGERYLRVDGQSVQDDLNPLFGYFPVAHGQWVQLHTNFPHHLNGVLKILGCEPTREAVTQALKHWSAEKLESQLEQAGLVGSAIRTPAQWQSHPQAAALAGLPLFEIVRIGDAPPEAIGRGLDPHRPLSGVRVLDLSRVIAAPVAARTLAQHGADVLAIGAKHLPNIRPFVIDTGRGKRSAFLDLREADQKEQLLSLVRDADVFVQAYSPGSLLKRGFGPESLARVRPGLIYVTLSAYGHVGPWSSRRGYDSLVQSATGIAFAEGEAAGLTEPGKLPCQALDHATGYLAALGAMVALQRRATEGGSWMVRVSLAQTARWLRTLGEIPQGHLAPELTEQEIAPWMLESDSPFGRVNAVAPVEQMSLTPAHWVLPPVPLGTHTATWL